MIQAALVEAIEWPFPLYRAILSSLHQGTCSLSTHFLVSMIRGFLEHFWSLELNITVCKSYPWFKRCKFLSYNIAWCCNTLMFLFLNSARLLCSTTICLSSINLMPKPLNKVSNTVTHFVNGS